MDNKKTPRFETPMMQQYAKIKREYPDCLLFFRLGDFYELFLDDAKIGSKLLDITLTSRHKGQDGDIPMCGVPFHAIDSYLPKIVKAGYKAAICEQTSKPQKGPEIVEREVVRIVTPGTVLDENMLDNKSNNFLLTLNYDILNYYYAYTDLSTGEFYAEIEPKENAKGSSATETPFSPIINKIKKIKPSEIILDASLYSDYKLLKSLKDGGNQNIYAHYRKNPEPEDVLKILRSFFNVKTLKVFDIDENNTILISNIEFLLSYLLYTQKENVHHINKIIRNDDKKFVKIDADTIRNLEIFQSSQSITSGKNNHNLFNTIDQTQTSMGGRMLKSWIQFPLIGIADINRRSNIVSVLLNDNNLKRTIAELLKNILDLERMLSKIGTNTANGRDLVAFNESIKSGVRLLQLISETPELLSNLELKKEDSLTQKNKLVELIGLIEKTLSEDPPISVREGRMIRRGVNEELDDIIASIKESKEWIAELEGKEKTKTGISNLKVGYNSVFGYYIEITKSNISKAPADYIRKQTLVNAERYITEELKYREQIVLNAEEKINELEFEIFMNLLGEITKFSEAVQALAQIIATIDVLNSFSELALTNNYIKPIIKSKENYNIILKESRHPVVENVLDRGEFTPNDTTLSKDKFIHLITGPNMAGKSTYIRQIALIQLLAQIGSFVPAEKAEISIVDGIYTRIGAGDALSEGLSTFMVEMIETAKILNNASEYSLIILDEVGRGTSTIDGLCIARAVVEYIHSKTMAKTLFATHFHELISLEQRYKKIENYHVKITEIDNEIKFLHKVEIGGTDKSYGIEVAKLAGLPDEIVSRAKELLSKAVTDQLKFDI